MSYRCPTCNSLIHIDPGSVEMPCAACWSETTPQQRAPWILRVRRANEGTIFTSRDPIAIAPATVKAYVALLEQRLAEKEKALSQMPRWMPAKDVPFGSSVLATAYPNGHIEPRSWDEENWSQEDMDDLVSEGFPDTARVLIGEWPQLPKVTP